MCAVLAVAGMLMQASQDTGQLAWGTAQANASPKFDQTLNTSANVIASHTTCHVAAQAAEACVVGLVVFRARFYGWGQPLQAVPWPLAVSASILAPLIASISSMC